MVKLKKSVIIKEKEDIDMNKKYGFKLSCKTFRSNHLTAMLHSRLSRFSQTKFCNSVAHSYGFTFAEVMITLVIVGIVSMLVVPNLLDSSNQKVNIAAAKKAKYEIAQASLMAQTDCIRWRCNDPAAKIQEHLRNTKEIMYKINNKVTNDKITVLACVDGTNKTTNIAYSVTNKGTVEDIADCDVDSYEKLLTKGTGTNCNSSNSWANATTGDNNDWLSGRQ